MKVLITGSPRSGTKSMSISLRKMGIDMPHEKMGEDGTVSCFFFMNAEWYPRGDYGPTHVGDGVPSNYDWWLKIHLTRHPLKCIASMRSIVGKDHQQWFNQYHIVPDEYMKPKLLLCMKAWYEQNYLMIKDKSMNRLMIEKVSTAKLTKLFMRDMSDFKLVHSHKATGYLTPKPLTWSMLKKVDPVLTVKIKMLSNKLGYK